MADSEKGLVALVYPGDYETRRKATPENNRLARIFQELEKLGLHAEPAVYHDDFRDEVRKQLMRVDAVLVWMNPIQDGRDRSLFDPMLREVARAGIFVSTHPDVILKMGTKEVLYTTREIGWGSDVRLYAGPEQMREDLPGSLAGGNARVLKQYRGNGGDGVWKVEFFEPVDASKPDPMLRVRHAKRGSLEEPLSLGEFMARCEGYFQAGGMMIDQAFQERLPEGMVRCYLVQDKVEGFGLQATNALYPAPPGAPASEAPQPGPRLYHPPTLPEFQTLKAQLEEEWVPAMQRVLDIKTEDLPILWDCDFLLGPKDDSGGDTYVLCEINVSSIAPFPDSAAAPVARATMERLRALRRGRR